MTGHNMQFHLDDGYGEAIYQLTGETHNGIPMAVFVARVQPLPDIASDLLNQDIDAAFGELTSNRRSSYMFETPEVNPSTEEGDVNVTVEAPEPEQQDEGNGGEQNTDDQA